MSNHMHIIMSEQIKGVGLMIGAPFWVAEHSDTESHMLDSDVTKEEIMETSLAKALELEADGSIDDLSNIAGAPVYILSGLNDQVVVPAY